MKRIRWIIPTLLLFLFITVSVVTLKDYGWNWDTFQHLARGQAYYHFFVTGKTSNDDVVPFDGRMSFYEKTPYDFTWASKMTIGHPPTTDVILAFFNQTFYKRLGIVGDLDAYHLYGIILTGIGGLVILLWSYKICGLLGSFVSILAYTTFPLLFAEQHFNIKDPAIASYNIIFLYFFWFGISKKKPFYFLLAGIVGGVSMGTKFNILFLLPVIIVWIVFIAKGNILRWMRGNSLRFLIFLLTIPFIMFGIFYCTYPALWTNPVQNILGVVRYYQDIGGNRCPYMFGTGLWYVYCSDWNTLRLFFVTLPVPTILLAIIGSVFALKSFATLGFAPLLWFIATSFLIIRVIVPINSLYGGSLRQIMELIGPIALLAGFGAMSLQQQFKKKYILPICICLCYLFVIRTMVGIHPNENLYTNVLLSIIDTKNKQQYKNGLISYGNAFKPGIDWINEHAEYNAKVSPIVSLGSSIPANKFRSDILFTPDYQSYDKQGEYLVELIGPENSKMQFFPYKYVMNELEPVFEKSIDGYPIVRVWKNDLAETKVDFRESEPASIDELQTKQDELVIRLKGESRLKSVQIQSENVACQQNIFNSYVLVSKDGNRYTRMYEPMSEFNRTSVDNFIYPFAGETGVLIKLFTFGTQNCDWNSVEAIVDKFK